MIRHLLGIVGAIALLLLFTFLPFFPGRYDSLAIPLSMMAQVGTILGLLFVPCGLLWIVGDRSQRLSQRRIIFPALALAASSLVWAGVFVAALTHSGFALGFAVMILWLIVFGRVLRWFRRRESTPQIRSALPFYLAIVPVVVVVLQFALLGRAVEFSRNRAIENSAPLIAAIEQHRANNGRYPPSLHSVAQDYHPGVIGVDRYRYEPHGEAYNLFFEQFSDKFGTQEFVVYNPLDEQVMTVHASDLLEMTPQQLALDRTRGYYAVNNAPQPHWKYFWFD